MEAISMHTCRNLVLFLIFGALLNHGVEGRTLSTRDIEIKRYLKKMNKPAVKTIKSPTGELIDCVDIYKQPSLDHPLLQNHTLQLKPSFNASDVHEEESSNEISQDWHINGKCPEGTVPIQRILESDILRASSLESFGKKYPPNFIPGVQAYADHRKHEHSIVYQLGGPYFGAKADINIWNPRVEDSDFSLAQIWVVSDSSMENTIEAGVMVNPPIYMDHDTRLFVYWTADNYQSTGCYNLLCQGFVQTSHAFALNTKFTHMSSYDNTQYQFNLKIFKDNKKDGNWWLMLNDKQLGYWPNELLKGLQGGSKLVEWGGEVLNSNFVKGNTTTEMGSGHFSGEGFKKAAFFRNIQTFDENGNLQDPTELQMLIEKPKCYDLQFDGTTDFYYGGPGKNADCP